MVLQASGGKISQHLTTDLKKNKEKYAVTSLQDSVYIDQAPWRRMRYLMTFMMTTLLASAFCMRVTLSIAIVAMTSNTTNTAFTTFDWDLPTQSTVLSSFFWGAVPTNVPAAVVINRYGARWVLLVAMTVGSTAAYLTPLVCEVGGWQGLCVLRVIQGVTQGTIFPAINYVIGKWAPPHERGRLGSIALSGMQIGSILTLPVSGELAAGPGGWPSTFYTFGSVGMAWAIVWAVIGYDSPTKHPHISLGEKNYVESFNSDNKKTLQTPWKALAKSPPVYSIVISHCVFTWGFYMLLTEMPTYVNYVLKFNIKDNGMLTCLPYLVMLLLTFAFGWISDVIVAKQLVKLVTARKIFNTIGSVGPLLTMVGLCFVGEQQKQLAVALLVLSAGLNAGVFIGWFVTHLDLSPNFAGIIMGLSNGIGNCVSIVVPLAVGAVVQDVRSEDQWQILFWITAGMYLLGATVFLIFGKAEIQEWNEPKKEVITHENHGFEEH